MSHDFFIGIYHPKNFPDGKEESKVNNENFTGRLHRKTDEFPTTNEIINRSQTGTIPTDPSPTSKPTKTIVDKNRRRTPHRKKLRPIKRNRSLLRRSSKLRRGKLLPVVKLPQNIVQRNAAEWTGTIGSRRSRLFQIHQIYRIHFFYISYFLNLSEQSYFFYNFK